jgi:hypothetical protein
MLLRPVLLDTCAVIWLMNGDPITAQSRESITAAQAGNLGVYVSPMTAWEIATLVAKNRLYPLAGCLVRRAPGATRRAARRNAVTSFDRVDNAAGRPAK